MMQKRSACIRGEKCLPLVFKARLNCAVTHHPELTSTEIADQCAIQHARLMAYASESQPNDNIPFKALLRVCARLNRWDLIDAELNTYHRGVVEFEAQPSSDALNESIDVSTSAARLLDQVREAVRTDGRIDTDERAKTRELLRTVRAEIEQLDASLDDKPDAKLAPLTRVR